LPAGHLQWWCTYTIIVCGMFSKIHTFKSLISRKCKCPSPNELHLYTARPTAFHRCIVRLSVQLLLCSWLFNTFLWDRNPSKVLLPVGDLESLLIHGSLGWVFIQNGRSIDLATFAQFTLQWAATFLLQNCSSPGGSAPHLINGSLGPPESPSWMIHRSV